MSESTSHYIKNHYGTCSKDKCICVVHGWIGENCSHWNSCGANTFEELKLWQYDFVKMKNE